MKNKPEYFDRKINISEKEFYLNSQDRVYVPKTPGEFEKFIEDLWEILPKKQRTEEFNSNKKLVLKFPWLFPVNRWDGGMYLFKTLDFEKEQKYDIHHLDNPFNYIEGDWVRKSAPETFLKFQEELMNVFTECGYPEFKYHYAIIDVKEKYGTLRWYSNGGPDGTYEVESKYCEILEKELGLEDWELGLEDW